MTTVGDCPKTSYDQTWWKDFRDCLLSALSVCANRTRAENPTLNSQINSFPPKSFIFLTGYKWFYRNNVCRDNVLRQINGEICCV